MCWLNAIIALAGSTGTHCAGSGTGHRLGCLCDSRGGGVGGGGGVSGGGGGGVSGFGLSDGPEVREYLAHAVFFLLDIALSKFLASLYSNTKGAASEGRKRERERGRAGVTCAIFADELTLCKCQKAGWYEQHRLHDPILLMWHSSIKAARHIRIAKMTQ